jgi:uncharacterized protein (TIGR02271 family)
MRTKMNKRMMENEKISKLSDGEKEKEKDDSSATTSTIPVMEEFLQVEKRNVTTGTVRIDKKIKEEKVDLDVPVEREELKVERVPKNQYIEGTPPAFRQEGNTTIIPVLREVVEKRLLLVEELRLTKRKVKGKEKKTVNLRKEVVTVERIEGPLPDDRKK